MCAFSGITEAAEVLMPAKVELVRCVTQEERIQMCKERNLCCYLIDLEMKEITE